MIARSSLVHRSMSIEVTIVAHDETRKPWQGRIDRWCTGAPSQVARCAIRRYAHAICRRVRCGTLPATLRNSSPIHRHRESSRSSTSSRACRCTRLSPLHSFALSMRSTPRNQSAGTNFFLLCSRDVHSAIVRSRWVRSSRRDNRRLLRFHCSRPLVFVNWFVPPPFFCICLRFFRVWYPFQIDRSLGMVAGEPSP